MKRMISILIVAMSVFSLSALEQSDLLGREIVDSGKVLSISGTLKEMDGEWTLNTGKEVYNLHLGNHDYLETVDLKLIEGREAVAKGFVNKLDMAVGTISMGSKSWTLRDESGRPAWAGKGRGRNRRD